MAGSFNVLNSLSANDYKTIYINWAKETINETEESRQ